MRMSFSYPCVFVTAVLRWFSIMLPKSVRLRRWTSLRIVAPAFNLGYLPFVCSMLTILSALCHCAWGTSMFETLPLNPYLIWHRGLNSTPPNIFSASSCASRSGFGSRCANPAHDCFREHAVTSRIATSVCASGHIRTSCRTA